MLQIKIIIGYMLLLISLGTIIGFVWFEHLKIEEINKNELYIGQKNKAIYQAFEKLLDFSFSDEILLIRDESKLDEYQMKSKMAINALNNLKRYYSTNEQHLKIDSVSSFLIEKERLLLGVMEILIDIPRIDSLFQQNIPIIVAQSQQMVKKETTEKKQSKFWSFFKKKDKKSAYASSKDKKEQLLVHQLPIGRLYSLQKEIHSQYTDYWNKLTVYSDSLQQRNMELNSQINKLISEFEQTAIIQAEEGLIKITELRRESFRIILFIAFTAILLIVILYFFIHHDIMNRLEYRKRLEASDCRNRELLTARRNLILTVSHDLRAPLGTISEYAELLQDEKDAEQSKGYALNILRASRHVIGLANNLLYYYRLEAQKEQPEREIFHLGQTIENAVSAFFPFAEKKGLGLTTEVKSLDLLVRGDAGRLIQIINNLLSNAIKFTHTGYIHVNVRYQDEQLYLFVKDTGIGIEKERQQQIFTAFERGEISGTGDGYGLGLAITSKLVSLLDGDIRVQSVFGQGSTFFVCLPLEEADRRMVTEQTPFENDLFFPIRVLAIDDDRLQLDAIRKMYARSGIECDCCLNVGELVEALRHNSYDLALTDIRMSETDGYGVLSLLRGSNVGQSKTIPVLAVTARTDKKREYFKKAGFADCLYKPFSQKELLAATFNIDRPNFTAMLEDKENTTEMLQIFIEDTEEELDGMRKAFWVKDYKKLGHYIHKAAPLWEMIRIDIPLGELEYMASLPVEKWCDVPDKHIERLMDAVNKAVKKAKKIKEETNG